MTDESMFGPGHDRDPGIQWGVGAMPPPFIEFMVESSAMHSRSRGWLPSVIIRTATMDGSGLVGVIECGAELDEIIESLIVARDRAKLDVEVGIADGTLPETP
jgi:hypothetical protein